jgi:hypothetical protein
MVYPVLTNEEMTTESQRYVSSGMEEMPSLNKPVQRLGVESLPLDLLCSGPVTHSGEILTTGIRKLYIVVLFVVKMPPSMSNVFILLFQDMYRATLQGIDYKLP